MTGRTCAECKEPFTRDRPATEPVKLRQGQPGATVPRLTIVMYGSLCAGCARQAMARRRVPRASK